MYSALSKKALPWFKPATIFMLSSMIVNGGNYLYNLWLGRVLGPEAFAEAGIILTMLLVISFLGMTFQLVSAKFSLELSEENFRFFKNWILKKGLVLGLAGMFLLIISKGTITRFFHLSGEWPVVVFALCLPFYFIMSSNRGFLQGNQQFIKLSASYQSEIWIKFVMTISLLLLFPNHQGLIISVAILLSVIPGAFSNDIFSSFTKSAKLPQNIKKPILAFAGVTIGYELIQIFINYGDLLMVKHYFSDLEAGLYTSMALVGRMIYFLTWMLVMILIPTILQKRKENKPYKADMLRYFSIIFSFATLIVVTVYFFPETTIKLLFGQEYLAIAPYLWKYALATGFFALANLFIYYFISLDQYFSVVIAGCFAVLQIVLYSFYHQQISDIIHIQLFCMGSLLIIQLIAFFRS